MKTKNFPGFELTKIIQLSCQLIDSPLQLGCHTEYTLLTKRLEQYFIYFKPAVSFETLNKIMRKAIIMEFFYTKVPGFGYGTFPKIETP